MPRRTPGGRVAAARPAQRPPRTKRCLRNAVQASTENIKKNASVYIVEKKNEVGKKATKSTVSRPTSAPRSRVVRAYKVARPITKAPFERITAHQGMERPVNTWHSRHVRG